MKSGCMQWLSRKHLGLCGSTEIPRYLTEIQTLLTGIPNTLGKEAMQGVRTLDIMVDLVQEEYVRRQAIDRYLMAQRPRRATAVPRLAVVNQVVLRWKLKKPA